VNNVGGTLAAGQSFKLFSAAAQTGSFTTFNLPSLGSSSGLGWQWDPSSGTLSVVSSVATNPTNITGVVSGGNLHLSWPADHTGWHLQAQTNTLPTGLTTNWYAVPGSETNNIVTVPIDPANPSVFFRLVYP